MRRKGTGREGLREVLILLYSQMDPKGESLHRAARLGDTSLILKALEANPSSLNEQDPKLGWTPLYRAVICGHYEAARLLVKRGADPAMGSKTGDTPLHLAAEDGNMKMVRCLLEAKADTNARQCDGETPLHKSASKGHHRICWLLLKHKSDPNAQSNNSLRSPLHLAVALNRKKVVQLLLTYNANPDLRDRSGNTAFDLASTDDMRETLRGQARLITTSPTIDRDSLSSDVSGVLSPQPPLMAEAPSEGGSEKISELMEAIANIPLISQENLATVEEDEAVMDGISEFSERVESEVQPYPSKGSFGFEPESEQTEESAPEPLQRSFSFGADPKKSSMYTWLTRARLEVLFDTLVTAGFDDISSLRDQMNSSLPLDLDGLRRIGVRKPGHRVRLLACLEEEAKGRFRARRRATEGEELGPFRCCAQVNPAQGMVVLPSFQQWLDSLNLQHLVNLFVDSGYDDLEHLLGLMHSRYPITEQVLKDEIKISKLGYRQRILIRLEEDSLKVDSMFRNKGSDEDATLFEREAANTACNYCVVI